MFVHGPGVPRWWRGRLVLTFEPLQVLTLARESSTELDSVSKFTWIEELYRACWIWATLRLRHREQELRSVSMASVVGFGRNGSPI